MQGRVGDGDEVSLRLNARSPVPGVVVVEIAGELDMLTAPRVDAFLAEHSAGWPDHLVLDLAGVTFLGSHGMRTLVDALANRGEVHGVVHLVGVTGNRALERVLDLVGLTKVFRIHSSLPELLRTLGNG